MAKSISQDAKGDNPQILTDNSSITDNTNKFNPDIEFYKQDINTNTSENIISKAKKYGSDKMLNETSKENVNPDELTQNQKRYRDTAYNIIWYAITHTKNEELKNLIKDKRQLRLLLGNTNQNSKNKGNIKNREKLEQLLSQLDDEYSSNQNAFFVIKKAS